MPNPGLSQAQFESVFDRFLEPLNLWRALRQSWRATSESKIRLTETGDVNGFLSNWTFSKFNFASLVKGGVLFIRIDDDFLGAGTWRISIYRAPGAGAGDLVAQGTGSDNAPQAVIAEQNSSGIELAVDVGVVTANEASDDHQLIMYPDWRRRAKDIFDGTESQDLGPENLQQRWLLVLEGIARRIRGAMDDSLRFASVLLREYIADRIKADDRQTAGWLATTDQDTDSGAVSIQFAGLLRALDLAMDQNTLFQPAILERTFPGSVTVTPDSTNRGKLTFTSPVFDPGVRPGTVILEASVGGSTNIGNEEVTVSFKPRDHGGANQDDSSIRAANTLRPGGVYRAPRIGLAQITAVRFLDKAQTGPFSDPTDVEFGTAANFTIVGESPENVPGGKFWALVAGSDPTRQVSIYKDSGAGSSDLVAQSPAIGSAGGAFTATPQNESGLTITGTIGSAPTGAVVEFDINNLEADSNDGDVPDRWSFEIPDPTVDGLIAGTIAEMFALSARLKTASSGSENIPDGRITRGGEDTARVVVG